MEESLHSKLDNQEFRKRTINWLKVITISLIVFCFLVLIMGIFYFLFLGSSSNVEKPEIAVPLVEIDNSSGEELVVSREIEISDISYILNELGIYRLRNPPFSSDTPKISFIVGEKTFFAEVFESVPKVLEVEVFDVDLIFSSDQETILKIVASSDVSDSFSEGIQNGAVGYEIIASQTVLLAKGYVPIYEEITGEEVSITGSFLEI